MLVRDIVDSEGSQVFSDAVLLNRLCSLIVSCLTIDVLGQLLQKDVC